MQYAIRGAMICAGVFFVVGGLGIAMSGLLAMADAGRIPKIPTPVDIASLEDGGHLPSRHVEISEHLAFYPLAKGGADEQGRFVVFYPIASQEAFQRIQRNRDFVGLKAGTEPMKLAAMVRTYRFEKFADVPKQPEVQPRVVGLELDYNKDFDGTVYRNSLTMGTNVFKLGMTGVAFVDGISTIKENAKPPSPMGGLVYVIAGIVQIAIFSVMIYSGIRWKHNPAGQGAKNDPSA